MHARSDLVEGFRSLGVNAGDVIMLHASVRSVGVIAGGPDQIHLALKEVLTAEGTLMMYAGCPDGIDDIGRGGLSAEEEAQLLRDLPPFDATTTRCARDHGVLVEFLRTWQGSHVNQHPARFVAWGRHALELFATQPWDFAFGHDSALDRFVQRDGRILLLGSDHDAVTFLHYVEHIIDVPGKRIARFRVPVLENGARVWRDMAEVDTSSRGAHPNWPDRFFAKIVGSFLTRTRNTGGIVGSARAWLMPARELLEFARDVMIRVSDDPTAARELEELQPEP